MKNHEHVIDALCITKKHDSKNKKKRKKYLRKFKYDKLRIKTITLLLDSGNPHNGNYRILNVPIVC